MDDFTRILRSAADGDARSAEALLPMVYEDLRRLAQARMNQESAGHTLQPTALVHEAWIRMVDDNERTWQNRAYFFSAAATAMRRILIDHARRKAQLKRGGDQMRVDIDKIDLTEPERDDVLLMMDEALKALEHVQPKWAKVVVMKYFGGMTNKETAESLGVSEPTVERYWASAKVWLYRKMSAGE